MREPTHGYCRECEESRPYEHGETDIDNQGREAFLCNGCAESTNNAQEAP